MGTNSSIGGGAAGTYTSCKACSKLSSHQGRHGGGFVAAKCLGAAISVTLQQRMDLAESAALRVCESEVMGSVVVAARHCVPCCEKWVRGVPASMQVARPSNFASYALVQSSALKQPMGGGGGNALQIDMVWLVWERAGP